MVRSAPPPSGFNILFLGDGFTADELPTYRAAVEALSERLLLEPPYCHHRDRINVFRIDVVDPTGKTEIGGCPASCTPPQELPVDSSFQLTAAGASVLAGPETVEEDLEVEYCWSETGGTGSCRVLWTTADGEKKIQDLAESWPDDLTIHVVVVLANLQTASGGGQREPSPNATSMVIVGVPMKELDTSWTLRNQAVGLLAHEMAHTFGLLDEYETPVTGVSVAYRPKLNVWYLGAPPTYALMSAAPEGPAWGLGDCQVVDLEDCTPNTVTQSDCLWVLKNTVSELPAGCVEAAHAWEGAFYSETGYYREKQDSLMWRLDWPLAPFSLEIIHKELCQYGVNSCASMPSLGACPAVP